MQSPNSPAPPMRHSPSGVHYLKINHRGAARSSIDTEGTGRQRSVDGAATAAPQRETWLLRPVADGLDVVAVRIADKCSEVVFVILRPDARLMQHLCSGRHGGVEERSHGGPVRRGERNVRLAEPRAGLMGANPEVRGWRPAVADDIAEVQDAFAAERG